MALWARTGHDSEARDQLELALHRLGPEPFVLMNTDMVESRRVQIDSSKSATIN
jgi:hypothetical protein